MRDSRSIGPVDRHGEDASQEGSVPWSSGAVPLRGHPPAPTPQLLRRAFGTFATGITVIGACSAHGGLVGMTVNSFTSVSLDPPLVLFCPGRSIAGFDVYANAVYFSVSILPQESYLISNHFANRGSDKWKTVPHWLGSTGAPLLERALATMECEVVARHEAGDHIIVLGRVLQLDLSDATEPLVFFRSRYRQLDPRTQPGYLEGEGSFEVWG
jgi:flavin reductase (DIM6/NTAB) family NADH-FMN oxidoreductase RutF